jgi:hypothetical protein
MENAEGNTCSNTQHARRHAVYEEEMHPHSSLITCISLSSSSSLAGFLVQILLKTYMSPENMLITWPTCKHVNHILSESVVCRQIWLELEQWAEEQEGGICWSLWFKQGAFLVQRFARWMHAGMTVCGEESG